MNLTRSYSHVGTKNKIEICHLCRAGHQHFFLLRISLRTPAWSSSMYFCTALECSETGRRWALYPFDKKPPWDEWFAHDPVPHCQGRSCQGCDRRLCWFTFWEEASFRPSGVFNWHRRKVQTKPQCFFTCGASAERKSPGLRSFSANDISTWRIWCPLHGLLRKPLTLDCSYLGLCGTSNWTLSPLQLMGATRHWSTCWKYVNQLWRSTCCTTMAYGCLEHVHQKLYASILTALRGYAYLGRAAIGYGIRSFIIKPKHHALHHVAHRLKLQLFEGSEMILSPQAFSCDVNEDFIGRISRLSRRVSIKLCDLRVCQRYHLKIAALLKRRPVQPGQPGVGLRAKLAFSKPKPRKGGKKSKWRWLCTCGFQFRYDSETNKFQILYK